MEKLKSIIPLKIKREIEESCVEELSSTSSSLHEFLAEYPLFQSMLQDLTNPQMGLCTKNKEAAIEFKLKGNDCFSSSDYSQAAYIYSQALRVAPVDASDKDNNLVAMLYVNRASSLHLNLLEESLRDCNRALSFSPRYAKAWYRRGKVNSSLLNYDDAICDLNVALKIESSNSGKRQIQTDLYSIANKKNAANSCHELRREEQLVIDELPEAKLFCVSTPTKGRGMASLFDLSPSSLVHKEEPYAAIILKGFRDTHCHFCFNELPVDNIPCTSCSIPVYCSEHCQIQAGGRISSEFSVNKETDDTFSDKLQAHYAKVTSESNLDSGIKCFTEHGHECHGVNWPVVLPAHVVLAGRILVKLMELQDFSKNLDLSHNYAHLPPESKVELHVYAVVLLYCVRSSCRSKFELDGATFAKVIILISQINVNSMAIVRMKHADVNPLLKQSDFTVCGNTMTSKVEQVRVGQAIYLSGSLFNHSCMPNIHAYFISRTLLIRATTYVVNGCPLEMSYGPQIGQWDYRKRQQFLLDNYSFKCQCSGCSRVNLPDLVLKAFCCAKPNCSGVVLDDDMIEYEKQKFSQLRETSEVNSMEQLGEFEKLMVNEVKNVACLVFECSRYYPAIECGCCLKCGSTNDLKSLHATVAKADKYIQSLQEAVVSNEVNAGLLLKALNALDILKSTLHAFNKKLAETRDILAEAFCSVQELRKAIDHCTLSIEILKKLYGHSDIALGNELIKLSSLQLALGDTAAAAETVNQMDAIFSNYYGKHAELMFPYLLYLKREVHKLLASRLT
ncbi:uncharacterized protein LOC130800678 isoform X3 [Amaranthus tricolor]|uniref:uncharacterized protein LOC130800678 isoform X3 n=1 Tax=Amaranthus tricolor TaxID=29722 RepID=UPI002586F7F8|nr:uncharacterized protein LOC130800678 isoform X3 [Amaranthus tricolor]